MVLKGYLKINATDFKCCTDKYYILKLYLLRLVPLTMFQSQSKMCKKCKKSV